MQDACAGKPVLPIDWMIVGGEVALAQGPMAKERFLSLFHQCRKQRVEFFFKLAGGVPRLGPGERSMSERTTNCLPEQFSRSFLLGMLADGARV